MALPFATLWSLQGHRRSLGKGRGFRSRCLPFIAAAVAFMVASAVPAQAVLQEPVEDYTDLWRRGEYAAALVLLNEQIELMGRASGRVRAPWMVDRAKLHFDLGQVDDAIEDIRSVEQQLREPTYTVQLAEYLHYRGRFDEYITALERATELAGRSWSFDAYNENVIALGRLAELLGENPRTILNTIFDGFLQQGARYAPGIIAAGDLSYRKSDYALASSYYNRALELEPDNLVALAGLAECYWKSHDERLRDAVENIYAINPRHPRARAIEVELLLAKGDPSAALQPIISALTINPNSIRFQSLQAAALFLLDRQAHRERVEARVLEFNPYASELYRTIGRIASRQYRFKEAAEFQRKAVELDPDDHTARAFYAFDLLRLGEDLAGRAELELAFEANPYSVQSFNMLELLDLVQGFDTVTSGPFEVQLPRRENYAMADDALALLGEAIDYYQPRYAIDLEKPVRVQIFDDHDDFMVRSVGLPGSIGYMGICFGRLVTMDSPSARPKWSMNWKSVLWHEFVHVVTLQKTNNRMPRWLSEGISVYEETDRALAWGQKLAPHYKAIAQSDDLPGLTDLEDYFTSPKTSAHLLFGYFCSGEFVKFYVETYGFDPLPRALDLIGQGMGAEDALAEASGFPLDQIDRGFRAHLARRTAPLANLPNVRPVTDATVNVMDDDTSVTLAQREWDGSSPFTDAMERAQLALAEERWDDAELALEEAHEFFPDYTAVDAPLRQLIRLHDSRDEREKLMAALRREIDWNPTDVPASLRLIELLREDESWTEMAIAAEWALGIDPFDVGLRQSLLEARVESGDGPGALRTLAQLTNLDLAHRTDYRLQRIDILILEKDWDRAKQETIGLLEEVPHYWEAQRRLLQIIDRGGDAPREGGRP